MRKVGEIYLAPTATLTGDVTVANGVSLWPGASVRGDVAPITLGENVNIQDNAVVHCDYGVAQVVEAGVVVGHSAVLHGKFVGRDTLVGIGAKLLGSCVIGPECIIGAGAVVAPGAVIPARSVVLGLPGKVVRPITEAELERTRDITRRYRILAERYAAGEIRVW